MSNGFLFVISGPSGSGKGTVCKELLNRNKDLIFSISATTRKPRVGEVEGVNYFFVEEDYFKDQIEKDGFLEYAYVHTNYYGTPKQFVKEKIQEGEIVILEIDVQGALQIKQSFPEAVFVFLLAPNMEELRNRIIKRGTESQEDIETRLLNAINELEYINKYDYVVINNEIDDTVKKLESIVIAEKLRVKRNSNIKETII